MRLNMQRTALTIAAALLVCGVVGASAQSQPAHRVLPGTRPNVFTTIQGNALNSTNGFLADAPVRLRDVRFGRIVDTTMTDKAGLFTFRNVDPGSYVVELVGKDQAILAASQVLNVDAGAAVSAVVKLPFRIPPFGGLLGHSAASALAVASVAAASGVLARAVTTCKSEPCGS
jgi:hypothetical protein